MPNDKLAPSVKNRFFTKKSRLDDSKRLLFFYKMDKNYPL